MSTPGGGTRLAAVALAAAGGLFALYPALRPWTDESTVEGATQAMSSGAWVASHVFAMLGFILTALGLLALNRAVGRTRGERLAEAAVVTYWTGAGLTLPYYGAEGFALNAIAQRAAEGQEPDILGLVAAIRFQPTAITMFGAGLLLLGVGAIFAALAVWQSGVLPRYSGIAFALGFVLYLPQFFTPPAARIAHGVLVAVGLFWVALAIWRGAGETLRTSQ